MPHNTEQSGSDPHMCAEWFLNLTQISWHCHCSAGPFDGL